MAAERRKAELESAQGLLRERRDLLQEQLRTPDLEPRERQILQTALAEVGAIITEVAAELSRVQSETDHEAFRERLAVLWLNSLDSAEQLLAELRSDPVSRAIDAAGFPAETAQQVLDRRHALRDRRFDSIAQVKVLLPEPDTQLRDLRYSGFWNRRQSVLGPIVPVLLPLRIETRFRGEVDDSWTLRLRLVPDEPWFNRHDPRPSQAELGALKAWLAEVPHDGDLENARSRAAFRRLADAYGAARAAWLVRNFVVLEGQGGGPELTAPTGLRPEGGAETDLGALPARLEVWIVRSRRAPEHLFTLTPDQTRLRFDLPDPDRGETRWFESFAEARRAGLAGEVSLGATADDIEALFVVGVGETEPGSLFLSHAAAGRLAIVPQGTATNTVDGSRTAIDLAATDAWYATLSRVAGPAERAVSQALTGDPVLLTPLPGSPNDHAGPARALVAALWPALWGMAFKDLGGLGHRVHEAGAWASNALFPQGPLPAIRIGAQPYGLLPVSATARWVANPSEPSIQADLLPTLSRWRERWSRAGEATGNVVDASPQRLLEILSQVPVSQRFGSRAALPLEGLALMQLVAGGGLPHWGDLVRQWEDVAQAVIEEGVDPQRRLVFFGGARPIELPYVLPPGLNPATGLSEVLTRLLEVAREAPFAFAFDIQTLEREVIGRPLGSLLMRLLVFSLQQSFADLGRAKLGARGPTLEPIVLDDSTEGPVVRWIRALVARDLDRPEPEALTVARLLDGIEALIEADVAQLHLLLRATLDTASHRIDPWLLAPATLRHDRLTKGMGAAAPRLRLGAYGWVDRPRPSRGGGGRTQGGLLVTPSEHQALIAAIIRDRAVVEPDERWRMELDGRRLRLAARIAKVVRAGLHPAIAVGAEVEERLADAASAERLRQRFPVRSEEAGRRVCDGIAVLEAEPASLGLSSAELEALSDLREALGAYSDLLVAEAVGHSLEGRFAAAGAAMEAAAGFARPPDLEILKPRTSARTIRSACLFVLAYRQTALPRDERERALVRPITVAEPSLATFIDGLPAEGWSWRFQAGDNADVTGTVGLADLGLSPADALCFSTPELEQEARSAFLLTEQGLQTDADWRVVERQGTELRSAIQMIIDAMGRDPARPSHLNPERSLAGNSEVESELRKRAADLRLCAEALETALAQAEEVDLDLILAARRWGLTVPVGGTNRDRFPRLRDALAQRLAKFPANLEDLGAVDLAEAIRGLTSPRGNLAVFGRLTREHLPDGLAQLLGSEAATMLHLDWLSVIATVRPAIAKLEAALLAIAHRDLPMQLTLWCNRPDDPWQIDPSNENPLAVIAAPAGVDLAGLTADVPLAVSFVDRFNEAIPEAQQTAAAAFGFDAPGARAQQSILLAVPPDTSRPLDSEQLVEILIETRALLRARMLRPSDGPLADLATGLPTAILPAVGFRAVEI